MTDPPDLAAFLTLQAWLSPAYPVGAFSYSHGLEWAIEEGVVRDAESLAAWLDDLLHHGTGRNDAILFACAHRAATKDDSAAIEELRVLAIALAGSAERRLETLAQGNAFLKVTRAAWLADDRLALEGEAPYPVAVGVAAAHAGIDRRLAIAAYLHGFLANLVSAGLRLIPLGQTDGQRVTRKVSSAIPALIERLHMAGIDDLGSVCVLSEIAAMRHETQYTRLFRT